LKKSSSSSSSSSFLPVKLPSKTVNGVPLRPIPLTIRTLQPISCSRKSLNHEDSLPGKGVTNRDGHGLGIFPTRSNWIPLKFSEQTHD